MSPSPQTPADDPDHWSDYWAGGVLTSLPQDFSGNYDGEIADFWHRRCDAMPDGAHVLDVCTGNGAVALLVARRARELNRKFHVSGVDAARLDPEAMTRQHPRLAGLLGAVELIGQQPFETLDWPDAGVDMITSQYGIEYCNWSAAAERAHALLRPGGCLAMIHHAPGSDMLATMRTEQQDYHRLQRLKVLDVFQAWLDGRVDAAAMRRHLRGPHRRIRQQWQRSRSPLLARMLETLDGLGRLNDADLAGYRDHLQTFINQLHAGRGRLEDMLRVNQAMNDDPEWYRVFERAGLKMLEAGEIRYGGQHRAGWSRVFEKPA